jgi:COMPASS component SPP1
VLSKYCSDWCGIERAANRLNNATTDYQRFWNSVRAVTKPEGVVIIECEEPAESSSSQANRIVLDDILLNQRTERLEELLTKKLAVERQVQLALSRSKYLGYAISRWENMCLATARALQIQEDPSPDQTTAAPTTTKPKRGGGGRGRGKARGGAKKSETSFLSSAISSTEAPCGFDVRLIWDDKDCKSTFSVG